MSGTHTCAKPPFFIIIYFFSKNLNTDAGKLNGKVSYTEPSVNLKLEELTHMVKTGPDLAWLPQNFKSRRSFIHLFNFNGNKIPPSVGFSTRPR